MKTTVSQVISALNLNVNKPEAAGRLIDVCTFINRLGAEVGWDKPAKHIAGVVLYSAKSHFENDGPDKVAAACVLSLLK